MAEKKQNNPVAKKASKPAPKKTVKKAASETSKSAVAKARKAPAKKAAAKKTAAKKAVVKKIAKKAAVKKPTKKKAVKAVKPAKKSSSKKTKKEDDCFLTTACVTYYSLRDDAYELRTLRTFRDGYMLRSKEGSALVKQYYSVAPLIVSMINKDKEHKSMYASIFHSIQKACREIERKKFSIAQKTYVTLVNQLSKKYKIGS